MSCRSNRPWQHTRGSTRGFTNLLPIFGQRRGGKSGRGAPGKTPFVAAVELNREGRSAKMRLSRVGGFRSEEIEAWARCHLEPGTVVVSDALGCFRAVRQAGCFHQPFVTGSGPASARHPALTWVNTILGNIKRSLHGTYHHLSSKHLPRYLVTLWTPLQATTAPATRAICSRLQSSNVLLANIGDFCSDYLRMTGPEYSRSLRMCSHYVRRTRNHRLVLTFAANDPAGRSRSRVQRAV